MRPNRVSSVRKNASDVELFRSANVHGVASCLAGSCEIEMVHTLAGAAWRTAGVRGGASVTTLAQRISYGGVDLTWCYYRTAYFVDKIFARHCAERPVEFPSKMLLLINLKTAKALGLNCRSTFASRPCRRGDRIVRYFAALHEAGIG